MMEWIWFVNYVIHNVTLVLVFLFALHVIPLLEELIKVILITHVLVMMDSLMIILINNVSYAIIVVKHVLKKIQNVLHVILLEHRDQSL